MKGNGTDRQCLYHPEGKSGSPWVYGDIKYIYKLSIDRSYLNNMKKKTQRFKDMSHVGTTDIFFSILEG